MKKILFTSKIALNKLFLSLLILAVFTLGSCKKEENKCGGPHAVTSSVGNSEKAVRMKKNVSKVLKDFIIIFGSSNQQSGSGGGSNNYSNVANNVSTYSTPSTNVYTWSDPTTGTIYTATQSTGGGSGGSGLGQLSYNGKSFEYNWVFSFKSSGADPMWAGLISGGTLRGCVALDADLTDTEFRLRNLAFFLVFETGGPGTYEFINWDPTGVGSGDGIGWLLDFSDVTNNSLDGFNDAHFLYTNDGHIIVADDSFEMGSDAKVTDVVTSDEFSIEGTIMFL